MGKTTKPVKFDEVGTWSELKLEILTKYAKAYTTILRQNRLHPIYIDGFAGAGLIRSTPFKNARSRFPITPPTSPEKQSE